MYSGFCICLGRQKPKTQSCLQGSMKLLPWEFTFRDMCIFLWVRMREKEREGDNSNILGEAGHRFIRLRGPLAWEIIYQAPRLLRPSVSHSGYLKPLTAPRVHRSVLSCLQTPHSNFSPEKPAYLHLLSMCDLSKALASCTSDSSYVSWANQS